MIKKWLSETRGVLTTSSARVYRESYFGNSIIAPNSSRADGDHRGFVPTEFWIMSVAENSNPRKLPHEGISRIKIGYEDVLLTALRDSAGHEIFGTYGDQWPLAKILDIGGSTVTTSFGTTETTPVPVHVHGGTISDGKVRKPGKTEAYFFPPTDVPPYNKKLSEITRINLKDGITKEDFKKKLLEYGKNDSMYELLHTYPIEPMTGWTIPEGVLHAPGPYVTFEIQRAQDDNNFASWKLGDRLSDDERDSWYQNKVLKGLKDEDAYIDGLLDWQMMTSGEFEKNYFHKAQLLSEGPWGTRHQIFFDMFYGEWLTIAPGQTYTAPSQEKPQAGVIWSGQAMVNGNALMQGGVNEFLCVPHTELTISNSGFYPLLLCVFQPIKE